MSQNSLMLGDEPIQPTQSVEYVLETETQEDLPETQDSVTNYDIFDTTTLSTRRRLTQLSTTTTTAVISAGMS